ncbi:SOS response-associated peptidase [soil metagenome]
MCGRYENMLTKEQFLEYLKAKFAIDVADFTGGGSLKQKNICPTDDILAVTFAEDEFRLEVMRWGFTLKTGPMFNSRIEQIVSGNAAKYWQNALEHKPCIIPMTGYFEWQETDEIIEVTSPKTGKVTKKKRKQPYKFKTNEDVMFAAGYWRTDEYERKDESGEKTKVNGNSCTMITTSSNDLIRPIQVKDRMPVILPGKTSIEFLKGDLEKRFSLAVSYPAELMSAAMCEP